MNSQSHSGPSCSAEYFVVAHDDMQGTLEREEDAA